MDMDIDTNRRKYDEKKEKKEIISRRQFFECTELTSKGEFIINMYPVGIFVLF